eukprot:m.785701 g.785701  ORF g.785701 m.785701 type:complete len:681 (-) comp23303_c0_seq1:1049-3091(-)
MGTAAMSAALGILLFCASQVATIDRSNKDVPNKITGFSDACPLGYDYGGNAGWNNLSDPLLYHPRFHVMPPTRRPGIPTGMNDYNAMFHFNGVYHLTYQDHINCPDDVNQENQSFGHVITEDLIHLKHLPPVLTDDPKYDNTDGPWDGPGFICNGEPTIIYNSHAHGNSFDQQTKTMATPVSVADKYLTNWTRSPLDPFDTFIGPSTLAPPWLSENGSVYFTFSKPTHDAKVQLWVSDAKGPCTTWRVVSDNFMDSCSTNSPELFPVPRVCTGCALETTDTNITHVLSYTAGLYDAYVFGTYSESAMRFEPMTAPKMYEFPKARQFEDGRGAWSESMLSADGTRRIEIGWVPPGVSPEYKRPSDVGPNFPPLWHTSTLMREMQFDPRLELLTFRPLDEYASLHGAVLGDVATCATQYNRGDNTATHTASAASATEIKYIGRGREFDLNVNFTVPPQASATSFGVLVYASADSTGTSINSGVNISVSYSGPSAPDTVLPGTDLPGDDLRWFPVTPTYPAANCSAACDAEPACEAWTLVHNLSGGGFPPYRCCLKSSVPTQRANAKCTSGIKGAKEGWYVTVNTTGSGGVPNHTVSSQVATLAIPMVPRLPSATARMETEMDLRVIGDRSIVEVYAMQGRSVITATVYPPPDNTVLALWTQPATEQVCAHGVAHAMNCAWVE